MRVKISLLMFVVGLFLLISCNGKNDSDSDVSPELNVIGENSSNLNALSAMSLNYTKKTGVKLNYHPYGFEEAYQKSNQDLINNTGFYDIIMQYNFSLSSYIRNDWVYRIDSLKNRFQIPDSSFNFELELFKDAWAEVGNYYSNPNNTLEEVITIGYPFATNTMLLVYNRRMFENEKNKELYFNSTNEELTPPKTWGQYYKIAEFFTKPNNSTWGVCLQGANEGWLYYEFCCFLYGFNGKVLDKNRGWEIVDNSKVIINSAESRKALSFYKSLKPFNAGSYKDVDANKQLEIMRGGKVAMSIMWSDYLYGLIEQKNGFDDRFGFIELPSGKSPLAGGAFFINKDTKYPEEALKYILNTLKKENQVKLMTKGLCSANKSAYTDSNAKHILYAKALYNSLNQGVYMFEAAADASVISNKITEYIQRVWDDKISIENALVTLGEEIKKEREKIKELIK